MSMQKVMAMIIKTQADLVSEIQEAINEAYMAGRVDERAETLKNMDADKRLN